MTQVGVGGRGQCTQNIESPLSSILFCRNSMKASAAIEPLPSAAEREELK